MDNKRVDTVTSLYSKLIGTINACSEEENVININDVQSMLSQYLFEFRKFLDNWETEIKRRYGKTSSEFEILKNARSNEYDTHMEYRIMYQLRNYDQHCGNILARAQGKVDEHENKHYIFSMKRDLLLENYDKWKKEEKEYLSEQSEYIDIFPYILQLQKCIIEIHSKIMAIHFNKAFLSDCVNIISVANEFENEDTVRIIANNEDLDEAFWNQPTKTINFVDLMVPVCKKVLLSFFRNNLRLVKVVYYGDKYKNRLESFSYEINQENAQKIAQEDVITINGQKMIRLICEIELSNGNMYAVLADSRLGFKKLRELGSDCEKYLKAICK